MIVEQLTVGPFQENCYLVSDPDGDSLAIVDPGSEGDRIIDAVEQDRSAGVKIACDLIEQIQGSGAFDGIHLIPIKRYRDVASRLEAGSMQSRFRS